MIQSVKIRQRGAHDFEGHYESLCALQDTAPLAAVKAHLSQGILDISGDRIRANDWKPILDTLQINKSLEFVAVRSIVSVPSDRYANSKYAAHKQSKTPAIRSREITNRLCKALQECLSRSSKLTCLELQGLPLRQRDLNCLVKGLSKSSYLKHLSMEQCLIGDKGLELVSKAIKQASNINSVNFSACNLSSNGAEFIVSIIKHQAMKRHGDAWGDSLRYRHPDFEKMSGIRRITLNDNSLLGDEGAILLAEALKDDLWLKALDLQCCGIGNAGAKALLGVLKYNKTMVVLDIRKNALIDRDVIHSVMEQLMSNSKGQNTEYKWLKTDQSPTYKRKQRKRATRLLNSTFSRKAFESSKKMSVSADSIRNKSSAIVMKSPGLPWRTAERADRQRGFPPDLKFSFIDSSEYLSTEMSDNCSVSDVVKNKANNRYYSPYKHNITMPDTTTTINVTSPKEAKVEIEQLRRSLREERLARATSDQALLQLAIENKRLDENVSRLKQLQSVGDERFLANVEASFKQFHQFLDMLTEAGLGNMITMAGLDDANLPFMQTSLCMPSVFLPNSTLLHNSHANHSNNSINDKHTTPLGQTQLSRIGDQATDTRNFDSPTDKKSPGSKGTMFLHSPDIPEESGSNSVHFLDSGDEDF